MPFRRKPRNDTNPKPDAKDAPKQPASDNAPRMINGVRVPDVAMIMRRGG